MRYVHGVRGDDDALDEYLDRVDALEDENDPDASDPGREQRNRGRETEPNTHDDAGAITLKTTSNSAAEATTALDLSITYAGVVEHDPYFKRDDDAPRRAEYIIRRDDESTVTYTVDAKVMVFADLFAPEIERDDDYVRELSEEAIRKDRLKIGSSLTVYGTWDQYKVADYVVPAPFDDNPHEAWSGVPGCGADHLSPSSSIAVGRVSIDSLVSMETSHADWRHDPDAEPTGHMTVARRMPDGDVDRVGFVASVDEMRQLAAFFNAAADDLDKAQAAVKAAQAEVITD